MPAKVSKQSIIDEINSMERVSRPVKFVLLVEEQYTPSDFLTQRYRVKICRNGPRGKVVDISDDLCHPAKEVVRLAKLYGVAKADIVVNIA